ncbi:MAG TPA: hypothetical protein VIV57_01150 [Anaeromyxobacter sp.]
MERCSCCGGELGPHPVGLRYRGRESVFCSFGCAVVQAAPACSTCGDKVLGRGITSGHRTYCSSACAGRQAAHP